MYCCELNKPKLLFASQYELILNSELVLFSARTQYTVFVGVTPTGVACRASRSNSATNTRLRSFISFNSFQV